MIAALIIFVSIAAADFVINTPNATWNAGQKNKVTWSYDGTPSLSSVTIDLVNGEDRNLITVITLASNANPNAKELMVDVTNEVADGSYALKATAQGLLKFSGRFNITGGKGTLGAPKSNASSATPMSKTSSLIASPTGTASGASKENQPNRGKAQPKNDADRLASASLVSAAFMLGYLLA